MALKPVQIIRNTAKNYNTIAKEWDAFRSQPSGLKKDFLKIAKPGMVIGDIGCGNGLILPGLLERNIKKYFGLDISSKLIAIAKEKHASEIKQGKAEFCVGNALKLPYSKNKFDLVYSLAVMHHLPTQKNHLKFLQEIKRVLKPGGKAFIFNWNLFNKKNAEKFNVSEAIKSNRKKKIDERDIFVRWKGTPGQNVQRFIHVFLPDEMAILSAQAGFSKVKIQYYSQLGKKELNGEELVTILQK